MIVKFFKNRGGGSAKASIEYLIGKDGQRDKSRILAGNAEISRQLADSLDFKNRYTVGCLSFEESELDERTKYEIMAEFEKTVFAGLDKERYNILWVEHTDKGRVELNFFIPNVELESGNRFQPYYDRTDRGLIDAWKHTINHEYGLSDPNDPAKRQILSIADLPSDKKAFKNELNGLLEQMVADGMVNNRQEMVQAMRDLGLVVARTTKTAISIQDPAGGQNIRFKGAIYDELFDSARDSTTETKDYRARAEERYRANAQELSSRLTERTRYHQSRFGGTSEVAQSSIEQATSERKSADRAIDRPAGTAEQQRESTDNRQKSLAMGSAGLGGGGGAGANALEHDTSKEHHSTARRASEHQASQPAITNPSPNLSQSVGGSERRRNTLDRAEEPQESRIGQIDGRQTLNVTEVNDYDKSRIDDIKRKLEQRKRDFEQRKSTLDGAGERIRAVAQRLADTIHDIKDRLREVVERLTASQSTSLTVGKLWTVKELRDAGLTAKQAEQVSNAQKKTQIYGSSKNGERLQAFQQGVVNALSDGKLDQHIKDLQQQDKGR